MIGLAIWFLVLLILAKATHGWGRGVIITLYVLASVVALL